MPTYRYKCPTCAFDMDATHSIHESPDLLCHVCDTRMQRVVFPVGVQFNGGGWSDDNYHKENK